MKRHSFEHDGLTFSYVDAGGTGKPLIALHGHWMGGVDFEDFANAVAADWRVLALDQRGHGHTDHTELHSIDGYVGDVDAFLDHLRINDPIPLLGHSFGGEVAYLYAARHPDRLKALIVEEMDVVRDDHDDFILDWGGVYPRKDELEAKIGDRLTPYLQKSIEKVEGGWTLQWDPKEILRSESALNGDHWQEWLSSSVPALIIRGRDSKLVPAETLAEMADRRSNTTLVALAGGHSVHIDNVPGFAHAVTDFLTANL